jgi:chloramphenicol-sensitive protein RarD
MLFGERLNRFQVFAVLLATAAVLLLSTGVGGLPLIGIGLALSFGLYGAVKKVVPTDPRVSLTVETAIAAPFAAVFLVVLQLNGDAAFTNHGPWHTVLLLLCGPVTAIPLLCFGAAAQRLPLVTLGLLQYLGCGGGARTDAAGPLAGLRTDLDRAGHLHRRRVISRLSPSHR